MSPAAEIANTVAPIATAVAAMMTAANLGPRVTGWGFVVFTVGSVAWTVLGLATGQGSLVWANGFLFLVNLVGIYRWLGREAKLDDGARLAMERSERSAAPTLFSSSILQGCPIHDASGTVIGHASGAMLEQETGRVSYLLAREGGVAGVGEKLHALPWDAVDARDGVLHARLDGAGLGGLPEVDPEHWPTRAPALAS